MRILILILILGLLSSIHAIADKSGAVSSKRQNKASSSDRGTNYNRNRNYHNNSHHSNSSKNTLTYDRGQQWYLDLYYNRNGGYDTQTGNYKNNRHIYGDGFHHYKIRDYYYPGYNYPYYYDYGYDRSFYDSEYSERRGYEQPVKRTETGTESEQPKQSDLNDYNYTHGGTEYYDMQHDYSQYSNQEVVDTVIYRWTDGEGIEHYTNNSNKVPEEFKHTIVEMETW